jgi:UDPglucose--hexose-1-phosphate uridylyltransferase
VKCVIPFKNKGSIIGVSLTHPHSQIYALPFIPPRIMKEIESAQRYRDEYDGNLFEDILRNELEEGTGIIYGNKSFMLFLPFFVMWPYEVHVYPRRSIKSLNQLDQEDALMLADVIRVAVAVYEEMFGEDCAYMMVFHQSPVGEYDDYRLHIEFYTPYISRDRIKYAAGIEWGAWIFTYDGVPEERVKELKQATWKIMKNLDHLGEAFT